MTIYLYVKTHNKTGKKYLGKTVSQDPHKYKGSGKLWNLHCKKHGYDYTTEIILETEDPAEITKYGLHYSHLWNVVEEDTWLNLRVESGDGGAQIFTDDYKKKISKANKGRIFTEAHKQALSKALTGHKDTRSDEGKRRNAEASSSKLRGRKKPTGFGDKISRCKRGTTMSETSKSKMKNAWTPERRAAAAERCRDAHQKGKLRPPQLRLQKD
jgi:hypothetical protein